MTLRWKIDQLEKLKLIDHMTDLIGQFLRKVKFYGGILFIGLGPGPGNSSVKLNSTLKLTNQVCLVTDEAPSDLNATLDGGTCLSWKLTHLAKQKKYFWEAKNAPGYHEEPVTPSAAVDASF